MFGDLASLNDLRKNRGLLKNIIWDIEPKRLMEPRCRIKIEDWLRRELGINGH